LPLIASISSGKGDYNGMLEETSKYASLLKRIVFNGSHYHEAPSSAISSSSFDGNVIFELPLCRSFSTLSAAQNLEDMDKCYDGLPWCKLVTTTIYNTNQLKFYKSYCTKHLACENPKCDYLKRASRKNEIEWTRYTMFPFAIGNTPSKDSTLVCKACKTTPMCLNTCEAKIYCSYSNNPKMSRATIHFGVYAHPVAKSMSRDSTEEISRLIAEQVAKTPKATNFAIVLFVSKDFLMNYLFDNGEGEKEMLKEDELEDVMDCFQILSSSNI